MGDWSRPANLNSQSSWAESAPSSVMNNNLSSYEGYLILNIYRFKEI